jgi:hypothetical protein
MGGSEPVLAQLAQTDSVAGVRGLELGAGPNSLVFQNIFVLETFRGNCQITLNLVYRDVREFQRSGPAVR